MSKRTGLNNGGVIGELKKNMLQLFLDEERQPSATKGDRVGVGKMRAMTWLHEKPGK
jgi:hypothetical protein